MADRQGRGEEEEVSETSDDEEEPKPNVFLVIQLVLVALASASYHVIRSTRGWWSFTRKGCMQLLGFVERQMSLSSYDRKADNLVAFTAKQVLLSCLPLPSEAGFHHPWVGCNPDLDMRLPNIYLKVDDHVEKVKVYIETFVQVDHQGLGQTGVLLEPVYGLISLPTNSQSCQGEEQILVLDIRQPRPGSGDAAVRVHYVRKQDNLVEFRKSVGEIALEPDRAELANTFEAECRRQAPMLGYRFSTKGLSYERDTFLDLELTQQRASPFLEFCEELGLRKYDTRLMVKWLALALERNASIFLPMLVMQYEVLAKLLLASFLDETSICNIQGDRSGSWTGPHPSSFCAMIIHCTGKKPPNTPTFVSALQRVWDTGSVGNLVPVPCILCLSPKNLQHLEDYWSMEPFPKALVVLGNDTNLARVSLGLSNVNHDWVPKTQALEQSMPYVAALGARWLQEDGGLTPFCNPLHLLDLQVNVPWAFSVARGTRAVPRQRCDLQQDLLELFLANQLQVRDVATDIFEYGDGKSLSMDALHFLFRRALGAMGVALALPNWLEYHRAALQNTLLRKGVPLSTATLGPGQVGTGAISEALCVHTREAGKGNPQHVLRGVGLKRHAVQVWGFLGSLCDAWPSAACTQPPWSQDHGTCCLLTVLLRREKGRWQDLGLTGEALLAHVQAALAEHPEFFCETGKKRQVKVSDFTAVSKLQKGIVVKSEGML